MRKHLNSSSSFSRKKPLANSTKPSFLKEHNEKIEQKLASLKSIIKQKKQTSRIIKQKEKTIDSKISKFLSRIGMNIYLQKFIQNGIQTYQLFQQIKQKQLEQIGIPKGHALKIAMSLKKQLQQSKKTIVQLKRSNQHSNKKTQATLSKQPEDLIKKEVRKVQSADFQIQTDVILQKLDNKRKYFCLFCYLKSEGQFCSQKCEDSYNRMFRKYEDNLNRAQKMFSNQNNEIKQNNNKSNEQINQNQKSQDSEKEQEEYDFMSYINENFEQETQAQNSKKNSNSLDHQIYKQFKQKLKLLRNQDDEEDQS